MFRKFDNYLFFLSQIEKVGLTGFANGVEFLTRKFCKLNETIKLLLTMMFQNLYLYCSHQYYDNLYKSQSIILFAVSQY